MQLSSISKESAKDKKINEPYTPARSLSSVIRAIMGGSKGRTREPDPHRPWKITSGYTFPYKYWYGPPVEKQLDPFWLPGPPPPP